MWGGMMACRTPTQDPLATARGELSVDVLEWAIGGLLLRRGYETV
jgi:hypothetical protein